MMDIPIKVTFQLMEVIGWAAFTFLTLGFFKLSNHLLKKYFDA